MYQLGFFTHASQVPATVPLKSYSDSSSVMFAFLQEESEDLHDLSNT
tara:strand:+ start:137 stop:277 length:141 start_codon:yes stop_codon:yes gene_type:complete